MSPARPDRSHSKAQRETLRWMARGMTEPEARNLTAYRLGLPVVDGGWTPEEMMRLLAIVAWTQTGRMQRG